MPFTSYCTGCLLQVPAIHLALYRGQKGCLLQVPAIHFALYRGQKDCLLQGPAVYLASYRGDKDCLLQAPHAIHFLTLLYRGQNYKLLPFI